MFVLQTLCAAAPRLKEQIKLSYGAPGSACASTHRCARTTAFLTLRKEQYRRTNILGETTMTRAAPTARTLQQRSISRYTRRAPPTWRMGRHVHSRFGMLRVEAWFVACLTLPPCCDAYGRAALSRGGDGAFYLPGHRQRRLDARIPIAAPSDHSLREWMDIDNSNGLAYGRRPHTTYRQPSFSTAGWRACRLYATFHASANSCRRHRLVPASFTTPPTR